MITLLIICCRIFSNFDFFLHESEEVLSKNYGKTKNIVDLNEDVWADLNEKGEIVGVEIWQARKHVISEILKFLERGKKIEA